MSEPSFEVAYQYLSVDEGRYANNPADKGGETYGGISRVNNPDWEGWKIIDAAKRRSGFPSNLSADQSLSQMTQDFYRTRYWRLSGTSVPQALASKLFDHEVNEQGDGGKGAAILSLQHALGIAGDGILGPVTVSALEKADIEKLRQQWTAELCLHYHAIAVKNPSQEVFVRDWCQRGCRWPSE
jgi:lysozyme family protein